MPRAKKIKSTKRSANIRVSKISKVSKCEPMTKFKFVMSVLWGTVAVLTFTLIFTVYATVLFFGSLKRIDISEASYRINLTYGKVIYEADKIFYRPDEMIGLDIVNDTNESIYLAPCQYFNKFEKKVTDNWQAIALEVCDESELSDSTAEIEKTNKTVRGSVPAKKLGAGTWRGVSEIYFGCQKPQVASCKSAQTIYTREFTINGSGSSDVSKPQL